MNWQSSEDIEYDEYGDERMADHPDLFPPRLKGRKKIKHELELPSLVRGIYEEAHQALCSGQRVLTGIGIRALVEAVCGEKKAPGKNLAERIDGLVDVGVLSKDGAEILHGTRLLGNEAAHKVKPPAEDQLNAAMDVAEHLLTTVYILPAVASPLRRAKEKVPDTS